MFAAHGYDQTSFQMIADTCKISQGAPLYHFKNKFGLFQAVIERIEQRRTQLIADGFNKSDSAEERLMKWVRENITWGLIYYEEAQIWMLFYYFAAMTHSSSRKQFTDLYAQFYLKAIDELETILLSGQREKIFFFKDSSEIVAKSIYDVIIGIWVSLLAGRNIIIKKTDLEKRYKTPILNLVGIKL